jgi:PAS domain-containing protein
MPVNETAVTKYARVRTVSSHKTFLLILIHDQGVILDANSGLCHMVGYSLDEL